MTMKPSYTKPNRFEVWGDSLLNQLPSLARKRRRREASKKRRAIFRRDDLRSRDDR